MLNLVLRPSVNQVEDETLDHILPFLTNDEVFHMDDNLIEEDYLQSAMHEDHKESLMLMMKFHCLIGTAKQDQS